MANIYTIKDFCNQVLKATYCQICEDCGTGFIVFSHDEYTLDATVKFRAAKAKEDFATALADTIELLANCEDPDEYAFYDSVRMRLIVLGLLVKDKKDEE